MAFKKKIDIGNGTQFKFEQKGQSLEGYYVGSFPHDGDYGPTLKHVFSAEDGLQTVFGQTHLTQLLEGVTPGVLCRITMTGKKQMKKGNPMKMYELEYDEDQTVDLGALAAANVESNEGDADASEEIVEEEEVEVPAPRQAARPATRAANPAPKTAVSAEARARANALLSKRN